MAAATAQAPASVRLAVVAALLSFATGAGDAFAFVELGGVFTANMTGSLVLSGLTSRPGYGSLVAGASVALGAFLIAVYLASRAAPKRPQPQWGRIRAVLVAVVALDLLVLILKSVSGTPGTALRLVMLAVSAAAMGSQTAAAKRAAGGSGVTTTFVTGTMTSLAQDAADGSTRHAAVRVGVVVMLFLGALTASGAMAIDARLGPAVAAAGATAAILALPRTPGPAS
ncbi:YoaK family protein [Streptomyces althioticus]|uniref:YoaK family protein n=1 Tax=Streptomyces TaxID=1883 RepID=UPI0033FAF8C6